MRKQFGPRSSHVPFSFSCLALSLLISFATAHAATQSVPTGSDPMANGDNFQNALDSAACGDTIVLQAGATYATRVTTVNYYGPQGYPFILRNKALRGRTVRDDPNQPGRESAYRSNQPIKHRFDGHAGHEQQFLGHRACPTSRELPVHWHRIHQHGERHREQGIQPDPDYGLASVHSLWKLVSRHGLRPRLDSSLRRRHQSLRPDAVGRLCHSPRRSEPDHQELLHKWILLLPVGHADGHRPIRGNCDSHRTRAYDHHQQLRRSLWLEHFHRRSRSVPEPRESDHDFRRDPDRGDLRKYIKPSGRRLRGFVCSRIHKWREYLDERLRRRHR